MKQTIRMMYLQVSRHAFRTKPAFVNRKVIARLDTDDVIVLDEQVHPALHGAVRAMRRHHAIDHAIRTPAAVWRVVQVRAITPRLSDPDVRLYS